MTSIIKPTIRIYALVFVSFFLESLVGAQTTVAPIANSIEGKVMVGYQGWFNCVGDGSNLGWAHWAKDRNKKLGPGNVSVDLWPDLTEFDEDELFATGFQLADGSVAKTFSSANKKTVSRHFQWMKDYEIDGAFLQRFAVNVSDPTLLRNNDAVLSHVRQAAADSGRVYAIMYDLSGLRTGEVAQVGSDWMRLNLELHVNEDANYLHHQGKPLVAVWGIGFSDNRAYSLAESFELVKILKASGCSVMLGVPAFWREGKEDAISDPMLHSIIKEADVISPWSVGRIQTPDEALRQANEIWKADREWCLKNRLLFLPVAFPGFSWHNLHGGKLNQIPRRKGEFLWSQITAAKGIGCTMIYIAMFDEVDEATAIFKCTDSPPSGEGANFLGNEGLPSDYYLELARQAGKLLRDDPSAEAPRGIRNTSK